MVTAKDEPSNGRAPTPGANACCRHNRRLRGGSWDGHKNATTRRGPLFMFHNVAKTGELRRFSARKSLQVEKRYKSSLVANKDYFKD